jgi:hypothetical protein
MSSNLLGPDQNDVRLLLEELAEVKELLRESSRQLLRIERRAKAAFPAIAGASTDRSSRSGTRKRSHLDDQTAQQVISNLKERVSKGEQIETQLREYSVKPDLQIFAKILGMTNTKLPPKDELVRRISTRLRQSVSVTSGIHDEARSNKSDTEKVPEQSTTS